MKQTIIAASIAFGLFGAQAALAAEATIEQKLEILQQEIEALKAQLKKQQAAPAAPAAAASAAHSASGETTIGGYGEAVYNNYRKNSTNADQADLRRFVLFFGHKFNDRLRFNSELEVEHSFLENGEGNGEVAMEQAYIEYSLTERTNARAGLMLMPLGLLNETHEPPTFYGVERNEVESRIIPSTWRELGIALQGEAAPGFEYNVGISTTPDASHADDGAAKGIREWRTHASKAPANDLGAFAALNYRKPGLQLGGAVFSGNTGHDGKGESAALKGINARLTLWDVHAKYSVGALETQALYARGTIGDSERINAALGLSAPADVVPKEFWGAYAQAAYHVWKQGDLDLAPFVRFERYNTQSKVAGGLAGDPANDERVTTLGFNLKVHPQVVFKADYQNYRADNNKDRFNLGVGYMF